MLLDIHVLTLEFREKKKLYFSQMEIPFLIRYAYGNICMFHKSSHLVLLLRILFP